MLLTASLIILGWSAAAAAILFLVTAAGRAGHREDIARGYEQENNRPPHPGSTTAAGPAPAVPPQRSRQRSAG